MRRQAMQMLTSTPLSRMAGPSNLTKVATNNLSKLRRYASSASSSSPSASPTHTAEATVKYPSRASNAYPFASNAIVRERLDASALGDGQVPVRAGKHLRSSRGLMAEVNAQLRAQYDPDGTRTALIARRSGQNIIAGSILNVETWNDASKTTFSTFAGVVIAIRHRNTSSSFTLRNIVNKTGVEVTFNAYSPLIKDIRVIARAHTSKREGALRRVRRAKLYYLRQDEKRLPNVARAIQVARAREERGRQSDVLRAQELLAKDA